MKIKCKICGKEFESNYTHAVYCSDGCRKKGEKIRESSRIRVRRKKRKQSVDIYEIIKRASELNMSYGEYVSQRRLATI